MDEFDAVDAMDLAKYARALVWVVFHGLKSPGSSREALTLKLGWALDALDEAFFREDDEALYSDGRLVGSSADTTDGRTALMIWHPQIDHPRNQAGEEVDVAADGTRTRVIISAPGSLDTITETKAGQ